MPLHTGQEVNPVLSHSLGRWYKTATGVIFRLDEEPRRIFEGPSDPIRHFGVVELLSGQHTRLVWRHEDTTLLSRFWPRWLLRLLTEDPHEHLALASSMQAMGLQPAMQPPAAGAPAAGAPAAGAPAAGAPAAGAPKALEPTAGVEQKGGEA
jgi:hypothetical protein